MINNHNYIPTIYVGYDPREDIAFKVLKYSVLKHASGPINIYPIKQEQMRRIGFYRRAWQLGSSSLPQPQKEEDIQHRDIFDKKPFATDFSFSRFLIVFLSFSCSFFLSVVFPFINVSICSLTSFFSFSSCFLLGTLRLHCC